MASKGRQPKERDFEGLESYISCREKLVFGDLDIFCLDLPSVFLGFAGSDEGIQNIKCAVFFQLDLVAAQEPHIDKGFALPQHACAIGKVVFQPVADKD